MADANSTSQHLEHHDHEGPEYRFHKVSLQHPSGGPEITKKGEIPMPMERRFQDKVGIVTEAADGIGFRIAERLAMEGATVVITSSNEASLGEATEKLKGKNLDVVPITCDVSSPQGRKKLIEQTLEKYRKINVLVSSSTTGHGINSASETEGDLYDKLSELNVKTHLLLFKDAVPHLKIGSSIVFVSSAASGLPDEAAMAARKATKTVLTWLTKDLSKKLNPEIRVNSVVTGFEQSHKHFWSMNILKHWKKPKTTLDGIGTNNVDWVAFLASDNTYISGETVPIHGRIWSKY